MSAVTPSDEQEPTRLVRMPRWKIKRFALFRLGSKLQKLDNIGCDLRRSNFSTLFNPSSLVWIYLVASHSPTTSSFIHKISNGMICVNGKNSTTGNCLCKTSTITANVHSVPWIVSVSWRRLHNDLHIYHSKNFSAHSVSILIPDNYYNLRDGYSGTRSTTDTLICS